jgi:hypothetical protein
LLTVAAARGHAHEVLVRGCARSEIEATGATAVAGAAELDRASEDVAEADSCRCAAASPTGAAAASGRASATTGSALATTTSAALAREGHACVVCLTGVVVEA